MIATIAPNGRLYVAGQDQPFTSEDIVWFLTKLCSRYRKRDLLVIWDGASIHRSEVVKALLRAKPGRIHLERLPAYSPERSAAAAQSSRVIMESTKAKFKESAGPPGGIHQLRGTDCSRSGKDQAFRAGPKTSESILP